MSTADDGRGTGSGPAGSTGLPLSVLRFWPLDPPVSVRCLAEGLMNRGWYVSTAAGDFFVKQFLDGDRQQIAFQQEVTAQLAAAGLPVPAPVVTVDGARLVRAAEGCFGVYPWVAGRHLQGVDLTAGQCVTLGRLLGRVHNTLQEVLPPVPRSDWKPAAGVASSVELIETLLRRLPPPPSRDPFDVLAADVLVARRGMLTALADRRPPPGQAKGGYIHGDFHALNLLYDEAGRVAAILDWDRLGAGPLAAEVVRAATLLFGFGDGRGMDLDRAGWFVTGYRQASPLPVEDLAGAVWRLWWERLHDFWMLEWRYLRADQSCDHLFSGAAALVVWWTEHYAQVMDVVAAR